jgi:surfeit locus 1 family protein
VIRPLLAPRMLALHALAIVATVAAVLLGLWQYGAWQHGREDRAASRVDDRPVPMTSVLSPDGRFPASGVGRPVTLSGRWLPRSTIYVADRELRGRRGVWAVTPVAVCQPEDPARCARASAVLVVRGWSPSVRTAPRPPAGPVRVTGWLQPGEGSGSADPNPHDDVVPQLRVAEAIQHVDQDLYGGYVIARTTAPATVPTVGAPSGRPLAAVTPAALPKPPPLTSLRNLLYAGEWWVFGGFAVFLWTRWCRDEVTRVTGVASEA